MVLHGVWQGLTALMCATTAGYTAIVRLLLAAKADVAHQGPVSTVMSLPSRQSPPWPSEAANAHAAGRRGWLTRGMQDDKTALMVAVERGCLEACKSLLQHGADPRQPHTVGGQAGSAGTTEWQPDPRVTGMRCRTA
jgi:ankyrin repeat protein